MTDYQLLLRKLLNRLSEDIENLDPEISEFLFEDITEILDDMDNEDMFGTEGWRRRYLR
jgi:hypothetical protein